MGEDGEEVLYTSYDFKSDEKVPSELYEMKVDSIYGYAEDDNQYVVVWLW